MISEITTLEIIKSKLEELIPTDSEYVLLDNDLRYSAVQSVNRHPGLKQFDEMLESDQIGERINIYLGWGDPDSEIVAEHFDSLLFSNTLLIFLTISKSGELQTPLLRAEQDVFDKIKELGNAKIQYDITNRQYQESIEDSTAILTMPYKIEELKT